VYRLLAYVVAQRRREFGIRMALGAGVSSVIGLVLRESVRLALVGSIAGIVLAFGASRLLRMAFWRFVSNFDVVGFVGGPALVIAACIVAAYVPSRRAATANPVDVLRADS
jgi:ABC-type antimicrobial peptide transport system permease subunit